MSSKLVEMEISQLLPDSSQPRKAFDENEIENLKNDIIANGLKEPLDINPLLDGKRTKYIIIDGERRFRAIQDIKDYGLVKCNLYTFKTQKQIDKHRASKHLHRNDWTAAERAEWLIYYMEVHKLRQQDLARELNKPHTTVHRWLAPAKHKDILRALRKDEITFSQSFLLAEIEDAQTRENALLESKGKTYKETLEIFEQFVQNKKEQIKTGIYPTEEIKEEGEQVKEAEELQPHLQFDHADATVSETADEGEGTPSRVDSSIIPSPEVTGIVAETLELGKESEATPLPPQKEGGKPEITRPDSPPKPKEEEKKPEAKIPRILKFASNVREQFQRFANMHPRTIVNSFKTRADRNATMNTLEDTEDFSRTIRMNIEAEEDGKSYGFCRIADLSRKAKQIEGCQTTLKERKEKSDLDEVLVAKNNLHEMITILSKMEEDISKNKGG